MKPCPEEWSDERKQIFNELVNNLVEVQDIDYELLCMTATAIDHMRYMNRKIDLTKHLIGDKVFMSSREKFVREVENCLKMLDITPQARNKAKGEQPKVISDPLEKLLTGD